jgi:hypothetical protein
MSDVIASPEESPSPLCYLDAAHVRSPAGLLSEFHVVSASGEQLGSIAGVVIEPAARRARFLDVESDGGRHRLYLVEADYLAQVDADRKELRLLSSELPEVHHGDSGSFRPYSDDDLLTAMFAPRAA